MLARASCLTFEARCSNLRAGIRPLALATACGLYLLWAAWLFSHPTALPSDDALYLSRGLTRFSVLEFSPHFPGYPGIMALGRIVLPLAGDPVLALFLLSILCAIAIPPAAAWVAWRYQAGWWPTLLTFLSVLASPLLPNLALSLLSDAAGLLFLLLGCGALAAPRWRWAGLWLGIALACRPSNAVMIAAVIGAAWICDRARWNGLMVVFAAICTIAFGSVLMIEGTAYVDEGLRFISGHTTSWGHTVFSQDVAPPRWWLALAAVPGGVFLAILSVAAMALTIRHRAPTVQLLCLTALMGAIWTGTMQNPNSLRHLAPVAVLACILAALIPANPRNDLFAGIQPPLRRRPSGRRSALRQRGQIGESIHWLAAMTSRPALRTGLCLGLLAGNLTTLFNSTQWTPQPPPLTAAATTLSDLPPGSVITNYGLALLRAEPSRHRIVDAFYSGETRFLRQNGDSPLYGLTTQSMAHGTVLRVWQPRVLGEHGVSLLQYRY